MKCPSCGVNHRVKSGMNCSGCNYLFSISPKERETFKMTDGKFLSAIKKAGRNGAAFFTENQLYAAYATEKKKFQLGCLFTSIAIFLMGIGIVALTALDIGYWLLAAGAAGIAITLLMYYTRPHFISMHQFRTCIKQWKRDGKAIDGLLEVPSLNTPPPEWNEDDIYDYGVERILIVNRDLLVDMFVKNNQHSEQRMLVISETGYPEYLKPVVSRLLNEREDLPVYLFHDADGNGVGMKKRMQKLDWLPIRQHPLIDMGFFPSDFEQIKKTRYFDSQVRSRELPADALLMGSLTLGLAACFASQTTFGEELKREAENAMASGSSFG